MKKRSILVSMLFVVFLQVPALAQEYYKFQIPEYSEPIYATWVNTERNETVRGRIQKWAFTNWGYGEAFRNVADDKPSLRFTYILVEKWIDPKGNVWYKELEQMPGQKNFLLCKISKDGSSLETIFRSAGFPQEVDMQSNHPSYVKYKKQ